MKDLIKIVELVDTMRTTLFLLAIGFIVASGIRIGQWVIPQPKQQVQLLVCLAEDSELIGNCKYLEDIKVGAE
ncbi:MAG: hypothetical protein CMI13_07720 [Oleibacter sp.]|nr:hypothetical protein [Thalassolituus sp.]|tara:strand:+ start:169 stop:387 length:219 start_codon:yes stop_codon:yes gene_type:complete